MASRLPDFALARARRGVLCRRHREQSEAIQTRVRASRLSLDGFASLAMTEVVNFAFPKSEPMLGCLFGSSERADSASSAQFSRQKFGEIKNLANVKLLARNPLKSLKTAKKMFGKTRQKQAKI
jgi:hypothetical protein